MIHPFSRYGGAIIFIPARNFTRLYVRREGRGGGHGGLVKQDSFASNRRKSCTREGELPFSLSVSLFLFPSCLLRVRDVGRIFRSRLGSARSRRALVLRNCRCQSSRRVDIALLARSLIRSEGAQKRGADRTHTRDGGTGVSDFRVCRLASLLRARKAREDEDTKESGEAQLDGEESQRGSSIRRSMRSRPR